MRRRVARRHRSILLRSSTDQPVVASVTQPIQTRAEMSSRRILLTSDARIDGADLATLAAVTQHDPRTHIAYFSCDVSSIAEEIGEVDGWSGTTAVALGPAGVEGWLLAETDDEVGRIWWWGPVVDRRVPWDEVADALYEFCRGVLPVSLLEEELAGDDRHDLLRHFADRQGFVAEEASVALDWSTPLTVQQPPGAVRPFASSDAAEVADLHDRIFPGTHTTGAQLTAGDRTAIRLVTEDDSRITGYVVTEVQPGPLGYIDFVGVDTGHRGRGLGRALVHSALTELISRAYVEGQHLGVAQVEKQWLAEHTEGIIALSGGRLGDVGQALLSGKQDQARERLEYWMQLYPNRFYMELQRTGRPKLIVDLLIAATAKQHGLIVATLNLRDFGCILRLARFK